MGVTNALFVAMAMPLSCAIAFLVMPGFDITLNMIVLFSFLLAVGIVVDDAIVVIENTHRIFDNGKVPIETAAKSATGEIFMPVLTGTITTLMPFIPLAFWKGVIGEFMFFLPVTLIITLLASLFVAYIINPVFAVSFMKPDEHEYKKRRFSKGDRVVAIIFGALALLCYLGQAWGMANFLVFLYLFILLEKFVFSKWIFSFQNNVWPRFKEWYTKKLVWTLNNPWKTIAGTFVLIIITGVLMFVRPPKVVFFPQADPNFVYVYLTMPVGTDQAYTNQVLEKLEKRVTNVLDIDYEAGKKNPIVKSVIANVTIGVVDPSSGEVGNFPNKGRVEVAFVEYAKRKGVSTKEYLTKIREAVKGVPGAVVTVDQESGGPPLPKPIVVDITGDDLDSLIAVSERLNKYLADKRIPGVEELRSDFQADKPEIVFDLNRERMNNESISTGQIVGALRTAVFGKEISRFRDANDDYPITLRVKKDQRENIDAVRNMPVLFRDMGMGGILREVPISAFANVEYSETYGGIKRKDLKRIISLQSNVLTGYNENEVVMAVGREVANFPVPSGITITMGGQQEEQAETGAFLGKCDADIYGI